MKKYTQEELFIFGTSELVELVIKLQMDKKTAEACTDLIDFAESHAEDVYGDEVEYEGADDSREGVYSSAKLLTEYLKK